MKKLGRLLAVCALLGLLLTGCNMPLEENRQVEDLLRAPQLAGDYGALQSALNDWLGESVPAAGRAALSVRFAGS